MEKSKRLRFSYQDEILLLREFIAQNPLLHPENWNTIQEIIFTTQKKKFLIQTLKKHLQLLLQTWLNLEETRKVQSGVEEPYCERDALLQEIHTMNKENELIPKKKTNKSHIYVEKQLCALGRKARETAAIESYKNCMGTEEIATIIPNINDQIKEHDYAAVNIDEKSLINEEIAIPSTSFDGRSTSTTKSILQPNHRNQMEDIATPTEALDIMSTPNNKSILQPNRRKTNKIKGLRKNALDYLSNKFEMDSAIKRRELDLEEKKLALEERRLELEEKRLQADVDQRNHTMDLEKQRLNMEMLERSANVQMFQSHQKMFACFMETLNKNK